MEAYLRAFVNFKENDWARLLSIAEFAYNNTKNISTSYTPFELNCGYHSRISYNEDVDPRSQSKWADKLLAKLRELMIICQENLHHTQEFQKWAHNKGVKPQSYNSSKKVWLNSKYIKTKRNQKLEAKFFRLFQVLHLFGKQVYKLELSKKWRIQDVFYMSLLEQDIIGKRRVDDENAAELDAGNKSGEYKVEAIRDSVVYARESEASHLSGLYYLLLWKRYLEEKNTW